MKLYAQILTVLAVLFASAALVLAHEESPSTRSFQVKKGGKLSVHINGGDIRITPWEKDEVDVKVRGMEDENDIVATQQGNDVIVENEPQSEWTGDAIVTIAVPSKYDLDLRTERGSITVESALTGAVHGRTSAGDIHLGNVVGSVDVKTSGGDVRTGDVDGELRLATSGGDITTGGVKGGAHVETSGGSILMENVSKELSAKTAGGDVAIGDVGGNATVHTAGGGIHVGRVAGEATLSTAGGDVSIRSATGRLRARTAGGNLELLGISGSVDGKTAGGDIDVEITPKGNESSRLATAGGNVACYIPGGAGATVVATIRISERWKYAKDEYKIRSAFKADQYVTDPETHEIHATYTVNGGGPQITLETVNADIVIGKIGERSRHSSERD